jgi:hypothetical protein
VAQAVDQVRLVVRVVATGLRIGLGSAAAIAPTVAIAQGSAATTGLGRVIDPGRAIVPI